jgi:hypothetical protein
MAGWSGLLAVGLYVGATILGGLLDSGYSHLRDPISTLTQTGAPHRTLLAVLYVAYNVALGWFAVAMYRSTGSARLLKVAAVLFAVGAVSGIGQVTFFVQDPEGSPVTADGATHIALAGVSSLLTVACTVLYGIALRHDPVWRPISRASFIATALIVVTGPVTALSVGSSLMGLFERVTIGCFIGWVLVVSVFALRAGRQDASLVTGAAAGTARK